MTVGESSDATRILATAFAYRVEIRRQGGDWHHIHHPDWETCGSYADTMAYATTVRDDHPGSEVRIVESADGLLDHHIAVT